MMGKDDIGLLRTDPVLNQQVPGFPEKPRPRRITHELKTWPEFFNATRCGRKKFELRRNDRDFRVGDELLLKEWDPLPGGGYDPGENPMAKIVGYTGRELLVRVDYVMDFETLDRLMGLIPEVKPPGYVIMSISLVH